MNFFNRQATAIELAVAVVIATIAIGVGWGTLAMLGMPTAAARVEELTLTLGPKSVATIVVTFTPLATTQANAPIIPTATGPATETATSAPLPTLTLTPIPFDPTAHTFSIGQSVNGRDLNGVAFPATGRPAQALVLVNGIHGDEMNSAPIIAQLVADIESGLVSLPPTLGLYVIESLNPDGNAEKERLNANSVDLNRNWETYDWRAGVEIAPYVFLSKGGGGAPFSEPETEAMRDWLSALQTEYPDGLTVIYFHAAFPPEGLIMPGTHRVEGRDLGDTPSREVGEVLAAASGYGYSNFWSGGYSVSGDASTWAVAHFMRSLTVELPVRTALDAEQSTKLREGILAVIDWLAEL